MPNFDDERFERYLKEFRPLSPELFQVKRHEHVTRRRLLFAACAAAAVLIVGVLIMQTRPEPAHYHDSIESHAGAERLISSQPLTIGGANALLARSPSVKAALDLVASQPGGMQLPRGTQSALTVLGKEKAKL